MKRALSLPLLLALASCSGQKPPAAKPPVAAPADAAPTAAADPEAWRVVKPEPGPFVAHEYPDILQTKLANGVSVYVVPRPAGVVTLSVVARGGAGRLPLGKSGLAALTARLMTEGTRKRSALALAEAVENLGTTLEQGANRDSVRLGMTVLKDDFDAALALVAEVVTTPAFRPAELERVRGEWLDDIESERQTPGRLSSLVGLRLVLGPELGAPVSGSRKDVKAITGADLARYHRETFVPENLAVVVVGDVTKDAAVARATALFGKLAGKAGEATKIASVPAPEPKQVIHFVDRPGAVQSALFIAQPFPRRSEPGYEARELLSNVFGGLFTSRLNMNLREEHAYTYGARSLDIATRDWGAFAVMTSVRTDATAPALKEAIAEIRRVRDPKLGRPLTEAELGTGRVDLKQGIGATLAHTAETGSRVEDLFVHELPVTYYRQYPTLLDQSDVRIVSEQSAQLDPDHMRIVVVGDRNAVEKELVAAGFTVELAPPELAD